MFVQLMLKVQFFQLSYGIRAEATTAALKFLHVENDTLKVKGRNKVDILRDLHIQTCKCEYLSNKIDIMVYLEKVSQNVHEFGVIKK